MHKTGYQVIFIASMLAVVLMAGCAAPTPTIAPPPPTETSTTASAATSAPTAAPTAVRTPVTAAAQVLGVWHSGNYFIRFDDDGTFRQAERSEDLQDRPYAISSYRFGGDKMLTASLSVSGVPPCTSITGTYQMQLLQNGNLLIRLVADACAGRAKELARTWVRVP